jgi:hypothetical protein
VDNREAKKLEWAAAFDAITLPGPWAEFGVAAGMNMRKFILPAAEQRKPVPQVYGFDSFEGLPETWVRGGELMSLPKGHFAGFPVTTCLFRSNVHLVEGWFEATVPEHAEGEPWAFVHMDADLYSSTKTVLFGMNKRIVPGTIIRFDEFQGYENAYLHEDRAFCEWSKEFSRSATLVAQSNNGATWKITS